jgi:DNA polymerase-4
MARTVIAHLDVDAFYASVELLRRPELRGKPVIVSGSGPRAVVTTASYEARRFGVGSAMPTARARRLCPEAILIPPDFPAYRAMSERVMMLLRAAVPTVEQVGLDEAYLDLSDLVAPKAAMRRLQADVHATTGLSASIGIGPNKLVAKVCSDLDKPNGLVAMSTEQAREHFAGAPPSLVPGIGPKTAARLQEMGLNTLGGLQRADPDVLRRRFGPRHGEDLIRLARFEGSTTLSEHRETVSRSSERTFDTDIADRDEMERVLQRLADDLCETLRRKDARGRTIAIKVRLDDFTTVTRARTVDQAIDDGETVGAIARELLRAYGPPRPVRLLGVRMAGFESEAAEPDGQLRLPAYFVESTVPTP